MHVYKIYGVALASELECPMLLPSAALPDVTVRLGLPPDFCLPADLRKGLNILGHGKVLLNIVDIAKYWVLDGKEVFISPYPAASEEMVRIFLLGSTLGILLHQRGVLPLHGCGIVHDGKAILFLGDSGIGKSTLAETFRRKGYQLITDDVSALRFEDSGEVGVFPSYPKITLTQEATTKFDIDSAGLPEAHNKIKKFSVPVGDSFCQDAKALARIYVLRRTSENNFRLDCPEKIAAIPFLSHNTYRKQIIAQMGQQRRHLDQCAKLAGNYPIKILFRPDNLSRLHELADFLESDFR